MASINNSILNSGTQGIYQDNKDYLTLIEHRIFDRIGQSRTETLEDSGEELGLLQEKSILNTQSLGKISLTKEEQEVSHV
jgi:hypothetical protein